MPDVSWLTTVPNDPVAIVVLAHGAGAPMDSDFMERITQELVSRGCGVIRFEFPYMAERRQTGKKRPPDSEVVLLNTWRDVINKVQGEWSNRIRLIIGGKSLGGRMASMIADECSVDGLVCLGYPFHPASKPDRLRSAHLSQLQRPTLIIQGSRDPLGNYDEVTHYALSSSITIEWLSDGDHDFKPRVRSGYSQAQHISTAANHVLAFIKHLSPITKRLV